MVSLLDQKATAIKPVNTFHLKKVSRELDELLEAAEGLCDLYHLMQAANEYEHVKVPHPLFLTRSMGHYMQILRNNIAEELEPIYEAFELEPPGY